jgi:hypothetical protein
LTGLKTLDRLCIEGKAMKEITAYLADDGTVYQNPDDAARADLLVLKKTLLESLQMNISMPDTASVKAESDRLTAAATVLIASPAIIKEEDLIP